MDAILAQLPRGFSALEQVSDAGKGSLYSPSGPGVQPPKDLIYRFEQLLEGPDPAKPISAKGAQAVGQPQVSDTMPSYDAKSRESSLPVAHSDSISVGPAEQMPGLERVDRVTGDSYSNQAFSVSPSSEAAPASFSGLMSPLDLLQLQFAVGMLGATIGSGLSISQSLGDSFESVLKNSS